jgi:hypothetical protein
MDNVPLSKDKKLLVANEYLKPNGILKAMLKNIRHVLLLKVSHGKKALITRKIYL